MFSGAFRILLLKIKALMPNDSPFYPQCEKQSEIKGTKTTKWRKTTKWASTPTSAVKTWPPLTSGLDRMLLDWCLWVPLFSKFKHFFSVSLSKYFFLKEICKIFLAQEKFPHSYWNFFVSHVLSMFLTFCMNSSTGYWQLHPMNQFTKTGYFLKNKLIGLSTGSGLASWARVVAKSQTAFFSLNSYLTFVTLWCAGYGNDSVISAFPVSATAHTDSCLIFTEGKKT